MSRLPGLADHLIDDAAVFPPGNASVADALTDHAALRGSRFEGLVGPLLLPASAVNAAREAADPTSVITVGLVADTGLDGLIAAREALQDDVWFEVTQVEILLRADGDGAVAAQHLLDTLPFTVPTFVEIPATLDPRPVLDVIATDGAERAKFRCGPTEVPSHDELATFLHACAQRLVPFKLTAGLHHALPSLDETSNVQQHGFLNALAATWAAIDGADVDAVTQVLQQPVAEPLLQILDQADIAVLRRLFCSFGSCSIEEPHAELARLSLLSEEAS